MKSAAGPIMLGFAVGLACAGPALGASGRRPAPIRRAPSAPGLPRLAPARRAALPQTRSAALPARPAPGAVPAGPAAVRTILEGAAAGINAAMTAGDAGGVSGRSHELFSGARLLSAESSPVSAAPPGALKVAARRLRERPNRSVGIAAGSGVADRAVNSEFALSAPPEYVEIARDAAGLRGLLRRLGRTQRGLPKELRGINWKEESVVAALVAHPSPAYSTRLVGLERDDSARKVVVSYKRERAPSGQASRALTPAYHLVRVAKGLVPADYSARLERLASAEGDRWRKLKGPYGHYRWRPMDKSLLYASDGDTVYYGKKGSKGTIVIRVLGYDTPEIPHFKFGNFVGQPYGDEAKFLARRLIKNAKEVLYLPAGRDKYGRTLAHILVDGELLSIAMLKAGLAYESIRRHGDNGMPDIAGDILAAEKAYRKNRKDFENPHDFREREWGEKKKAEELKADLARRRTELDKSKIAFDDVDTIRYGRETIRIAGIDGPEIRHPEDGIFKDQPYGRQAARLTKNLILKAKKVELLRDAKKDKYGRTLAHLFLDGELLSVLVIRESMAYENVFMFGPGSTPGLARLVLAAARKSPKPPFEYPWKWRQDNQKRDK